MADRNDLVSVTRAINGGTNGLSDRRLYHSRAVAALNRMGKAPAARADVIGAGPVADGAPVLPDMAIGLISGVFGTLVVVALIVVVVLLVRRRKDSEEAAKEIYKNDAVAAPVDAGYKIFASPYVTARNAHGPQRGKTDNDI